MVELEQLRLKTRKRILITILLLIVIFAIPSISIFKIVFGDMDIIGEDAYSIASPFLILTALGIDVVIACVLSVFITSKARKEYKAAFLELLVKKEFEKYFENIRVSSVGFLKEEVFSTKLLRSGNVYRSNDCISGEYKNISFRKADVLIQQVTSTGKTTTTTTYFKGQMFFVEGLNKRVGSIYIANKSLNTPSRNGFFSNNEYEKVETESVEFNKKFKIFTKDSHEVFYILTPHVMERFMSFPSNRGFGANYDGYKAVLALDSGRDSLEPSIFRPIKEKDLDGILLDIQTIQVVIDLLLDGDQI